MGGRETLVMVYYSSKTAIDLCFADGIKTETKLYHEGRTRFTVKSQSCISTVLKYHSKFQLGFNPKHA